MPFQHDVGMRGGDGSIVDGAQEGASVGHGVAVDCEANMQLTLSIRLPKKKTPASRARGGKLRCGGESDQPPTSPEMTSPNSSQRSPLNRSN